MVVGDGGVRLSARILEGPRGASGLLLLHGLASSQHIWDQLLPQLVRRFRVVTYDARGHGVSAKPNRGYGFDHMVADALAVAEATDLGRPVVCGHSWGAMVTLELAVRHPRAIGGAVAIDGAVRALREEMPWHRAKEILAPPHLAGMAAEEFRAGLHQLLGDSLEITPQVEQQVLSVMRVRRDGTISPRLARSNHFRILRAIWEQQPHALWARMQVPALAIVANATAGRADPLTSGAVVQVRKLTRGKPVRVEWMRGIHDLPLQHPGALANRIERFAETAVR